MSKEREALKLALEALESGKNHGVAIDVLRRVLAEQPAQQEEPDWLDKEQTKTDWDHVWLLIKAASHASSRGFISGTTNWGSAVSRYMRNESLQPAQQQEIDWKDQYEKQKRRAEMWVAKYEADIGPVDKAVPMAVQQQEPVAMVWYEGHPPFPQDQEWFIAETIYGDRVVLRSLDEGREHRGNYAFTTVDSTYMKAEIVRRWMQFPDCQYIPPASKPWMGLTDDEMRDLEKQFNAERVRTSDEEYLVIYPGDYWAWQRAIEAKLKAKNTGEQK